MVFINNKPRFYCGIDTHKRLHTACVINYDTDKLLTFTFKNEPQYFDKALSKIIKVIKCKDVIFGFEDTQTFGLHFASYLTKFNFDVKQVDPAAANAYRASLPTYHKSDEYDSFCVAKVLRDTYKQLRSFKYEIIYSNIKLLVNLRNQTVKQQGTNYLLLHQQLSKVYPGYERFFSTIHMKSALAFFLHFPAPRHLKGYTKESLREEMRTYTKEFPIAKSEKILTIVRSNIITYIDEVVEGIITELINDIYVQQEKLTKLERQLEGLVEETGYKLTTMPGINIVTAANLIAEIGNINRFKSYNQLSKYAGIAPITVGSGGKSKEYVSHGGNRTLRSIFYFLAVGMIAVDRYGGFRNPIFREYFLKKQAEGKNKVQALISIMKQLVRIVYAMMKHKSEYEAPNKKEKLETSIKK